LTPVSQTLHYLNLLVKNTQVETENLTERSLVAKRTICDYVNYVGGIQYIDVTNKKLILAATTARQKYLAYLNELHIKEANDANSKKSLTRGFTTAENQEKKLQKEAENLE